MQIAPSAPVAIRPVAGNTGPLPYIPAVDVANRFGADIRALGAIRVVPNDRRAAQLDVTFGSSTTAILAGKLLNDTIEGVKLNHQWLESDFHPVDLSLDQVVNVLKGAKLVGSNGVSTFGLNGTGSIVLWANDAAARDHLDTLLQDKVLGWNLDVRVTNPVMLPTDPVVLGHPAKPEPCWPGGLGRNPESPVAQPIGDLPVPGTPPIVVDVPAPGTPPITIGGPDQPCIIPGPNGERPGVPAK